MQGQNHQSNMAAKPYHLMILDIIDIETDVHLILHAKFGSHWTISSEIIAAKI